MLQYFILVVLFTAQGTVYGSPAGSQQGDDPQCAATPLSGSVNDLGFELSRQLDTDGNLFISPFSIYAALSMTYLGASGNTADQMEKVLNLQSWGLRGQNLHQSFKQLLDEYLRKNNDYSLEVANGLFLQKNYTVKENYVQDLKTFYHAVLKLVDFAAHGEQAKNEINSWVAHSTHNMIDKMLSRPLSPMTALALLNAIYFKGTWKKQFDKELTSEGTFYKSTDEKKQVELMSMPRAKLPFHEDYETGYKFLEMPYKGEDISMLLVLPGSASESPDLKMDSSVLCDIRTKLRVVTLDRVLIPKFHMEYEKQLKDALMALGIEDLFTGAADLSGIREQRDLLVSSILHKAVIDVNEEGSEASAATGVFITKMSLWPSTEFVADHPFSFFIIDNKNGLVLFSGRVVDP